MNDCEWKNIDWLIDCSVRIYGMIQENDYDNNLNKLWRTMQEPRQGFVKSWSEKWAKPHWKHELLTKTTKMSPSTPHLLECYKQHKSILHILFNVFSVVYKRQFPFGSLHWWKCHGTVKIIPLFHIAWRNQYNLMKLKSNIWDISQHKIQLDLLVVLPSGIFSLATNNQD